MLEYTAAAGGGARLIMLVHHDDARREYAYRADSKVGAFPDAPGRGEGERLVVISMKSDWKRIFAFEEPSP
jgi:hypothetical protein